MKLYHTTTSARAESIKSVGFVDTEGSYGLMNEDGSPFRLRGLFFSNKPLDGSDGLLPSASEVFVISIPAILIRDYELIEEGEGKGYREWCIPAELVNRHFTKRECIALDKLIGW